MGESDCVPIKYKTISPVALEDHIGDRAAMFFMRYCKPRDRKYTAGRINYNSDGELCLRAGSSHEMIRIEHGDAIRIKATGKNHGSNMIRDYIFIDDSD